MQAFASPSAMDFADDSFAQAIVAGKTIAVRMLVLRKFRRDVSELLAENVAARLVFFIG